MLCVVLDGGWAVCCVWICMCGAFELVSSSCEQDLWGRCACQMHVRDSHAACGVTALDARAGAGAVHIDCAHVCTSACLSFCQERWQLSRARCVCCGHTPICMHRCALQSAAAPSSRLVCALLVCSLVCCMQTEDHCSKDVPGMIVWVIWLPFDF